MQLLKALPRKKLGKAPFCLTLGLFRTALNAVIWDTLLVIQRPQVFLLSFLSVDILLSISPGLMQSRAHAAEFVPTINKICLCHTEVFGGSNWLIDLFAVEQAYFIYAECLHLSFPQKKRRKKAGNSKRRSCRKSHRDPCRLTVCNEEGRVGAPGARGSLILRVQG